MKNIRYILLLVLIYSCKPKVVDKPANFIPKEKMVDLLVAMKIAAKTKNFKNKKLQKGKNYMALVFEKYKIDSAQFRENNNYYVNNIEEYQEIYKKVHLRLKDSLAKYEKIGKKIDSLLKVDKDKLLKERMNNSQKKKIKKRKTSANPSPAGM